MKDEELCERATVHADTYVHTHTHTYIHRMKDEELCERATAHAELKEYVSKLESKINHVGEEKEREGGDKQVCMYVLCVVCMCVCPCFV